LSLDDSSRGLLLDDSMANSLILFAKESHFRRATMQLMAWSLTAEERGEVRDAFLDLDTEHTGAISLIDLQRVLEDKFEISDEQSAQVFQAIDGNNDGSINYSEFLAAMVASRIKLHDELLKTTFRRFDTHREGYIRADDFKKILGKDCPVASIMKQIDQNADGKVSYEEFIAHLCNNGSDDQREAAGLIIDRELQNSSPNLDDLPDASPAVARLRKRDRLRQFGMRIKASMTEHSFSTT